MDALEKGRWMNLKYIPPPPTPAGNFLRYTKCSMMRKDNVESFVLWNKNIGSFNTLAVNLKSFTRLKHLSVKLNNSIDPLDLESKVLKEEISNRNWPLMSILFNNNSSSYQMDLATENPTLESNTHRNKDSWHPFTTRIYPSIKVSEAGRILMNDNSLQYLLYKFPNLLKLSLGACGGNRIARLDLSEDMMDAFCSLVSRLKSYDLKFSFTSNPVMMARNYFVNSISNYSPERLAIFYSDDPTDTLKFPHLYLSRRKSKYQNLFSREINNEEEEDECCKLFLSISPFINNNNINTTEATSNQTLPHTQLITQEGVGEVLKELEINQRFVLLTSTTRDVSVEQLPEKSLRERVGDSIETILETCTSLKFLMLNGVNLWRRSSNEKGDHLSISTEKNDQPSLSSIETLKLVYCLFDSPAIYSKLFSRLDSLKTFVLDGAAMEVMENSYCNYFDLTHNTSLQHFVWNDKLHHYPRDEFPLLYLKLSFTEKVSKYMVVGAEGSMKESWKAEFDSKYTERTDATGLSIFTGAHVAIHIKCKSLKKFTRTFNSNDTNHYILL